MSVASTLSRKSKAWDDYCAAYIMAGALVAEGKVSVRTAAAMATEKYGVQITKSTAARAALAEGEGPTKPGRELIIPREVEHKLEDLVLVVRELGLPMFRFMVINYVNTLLRGTEMAEQLKDKVVRRHWYYNWLGRCGPRTSLLAKVMMMYWLMSDLKCLEDVLQCDGMPQPKFEQFCSKCARAKRKNVRSVPYIRQPGKTGARNVNLRRT